MMDVANVIHRLTQRQCTCERCRTIRGLVSAGTHDAPVEWPAPNVTMVPRKVGP